jgi:hypothetical protein
VLLAACSSTVERLKERLKRHFDVRMLTDVFVEWEERKHDLAAWRDHPDRITKWEIDNPEKRKAAAERIELEELEVRAGFSEQALVEAWRAETLRLRRAGPAPSQHTLMERIARQLKRSGYPATRGKVERAIELLERYRKETLEADVER